MLRTKSFFLLIFFSSMIILWWLYNFYSIFSYYIYFFLNFLLNEQKHTIRKLFVLNCWWKIKEGWNWGVTLPRKVLIYLWKIIRFDLSFLNKFLLEADTTIKSSYEFKQCLKNYKMAVSKFSKTVEYKLCYAKKKGMIF